jgi:cell division protein ZipA
MDGLRWLLLLFGVLVVAGVYFYSRYQRTKTDEAPSPQVSSDRVEPSLDGEIHADDYTEDEAAGSLASPDPDVEINEPEQKIVTLRIVARNQGAINGEELALNLRGIGMRHGQFGIYHRYEGSDEDKVIFSAASLVEPGTFDLQTIREQEFPGISLFMVLPGPIDAAQAYDLMISAARALAQSLDAELLDESGSTLSIQRECYLREEIIQFQHSTLVA